MTTQPLVNPSASLQLAEQTPPEVVLDNLVKEYGTLRALNGVSFNIASGEWIALMGPSGSGKTTLINILGGLDTATSGSVAVNDQEITRLNESALVRYRAEKIGFVFQQFHLVPYLTALENVMLAQYFHSVTDESQAVKALKRVGLADRLEHLPANLSGGEQQRVAIARALINQPKLILADEPTGNLDSATGKQIIDLLVALNRNLGSTLVLVTHDPALAALADRVITLRDGRVASDEQTNGGSA